MYNQEYQSTEGNKLKISETKIIKLILTCDRVARQRYHQHVLVFCQSSHKPAASTQKIAVDS